MSTAVQRTGKGKWVAGQSGNPLGAALTRGDMRLKMDRRLEADFPEYHPVPSMVEGALALTEYARKDPSMWTEAVNAHDKVAKYLVPALKATEVTVKEPTRIVIVDAAAEEVVDATIIDDILS